MCNYNPWDEDDPYNNNDGYYSQLQYGLNYGNSYDHIDYESPYEPKDDYCFGSPNCYKTTCYKYEQCQSMYKR